MSMTMNNPSAATPSPFGRFGGGGGAAVAENGGGAPRPARTGGDDVVKTVRHEGPKVGRNDPCPCGSGKKYKKCHGAA
jgi:preprotein translocase subunit SecA